MRQLNWFIRASRAETKSFLRVVAEQAVGVEPISVVRADGVQAARVRNVSRIKSQPCPSKIANPLFSGSNPHYKGGFLSRSARRERTANPRINSSACCAKAVATSCAFVPASRPAKRISTIPE